MRPRTTKFHLIYRIGQIIMAKMPSTIVLSKNLSYAQTQFQSRTRDPQGVIFRSKTSRLPNFRCFRPLDLRSAGVWSSL